MNSPPAPTIERPDSVQLQAYRRLMTEPGPWPASAPDPASLLATLSPWQNANAPGQPATGTIDLGAIDGWKLAATVYQPPSEPSGTKDAIPVLFLHGGAWVLGNPASHDRMAREIATLGHVVWSLDYPRAPKRLFPAAVNAVVAAVDALGGPNRPVAVCGDSAGGGLAASAALALPHKVAGLGLMYPVVDYQRAIPWVSRFHRHLAGHGPPDPYLGKAVSRLEATDWRINPLAHADQLPPTWVGYGSMDPLAEQSTLLESALRAAGVSVVAHRSVGSGHAYLQDPEDPNAPAAYESLGRFLRSLAPAPQAGTNKER